MEHAKSETKDKTGFTLQNLKLVSFSGNMTIHTWVIRTAAKLENIFLNDNLTVGKWKKEKDYPLKDCQEL